jgi:hypothetical protein
MTPKFPFNEIKRFYTSIDVSDYRPHLIDWLPLLNHIEYPAWQEISARNLPFWPQFPIGRFFADFADPVKKLVIECDGKKWHDPEKDAARDKEMEALGWTVFRVTGADCKRVSASPGDIYFEMGLAPEAQEEMLRAFFLETVDGFVFAIAIEIYGADSIIKDDHRYLAKQTIGKHQTTRPGL